MGNEDVSCGVHFSDLELLLIFPDALRCKVRLELGTSNVKRFIDRHDVFDHLPSGSLAMTIL